MKWVEALVVIPDQWLVIEALEAITALDHRRELIEIAIVERCVDGNEALRNMRQWSRRFPTREFYPVHTSQAVPPIYLDQQVRISPRPARNITIQ